MNKYTVYICTGGNKSLSIGAAKSIKKFCRHETKIVLIDGSHTIGDGPFDEIKHCFFVKWVGWGAAFNIHDTGPALCIDDDIRLTDYVSLSERYSVNNYKSANGSMIMAWNKKEDIIGIPFTQLKIQRLYKIEHCFGWDANLAELAVNNRSERIDNIWLHIDKGSNPITETRQKLIDHIDNN